MIIGTNKEMEGHHQRLMAGNYAKVEELIRKDRRVASDGIAEHIEITHESAAKTVGSQTMQRFVLGGFPDNLQTVMGIQK